MVKWIKRVVVHIGGLAFILIIPISTNAANWEFYAESGSISNSEYSRYLIDTESIRSIGNSRFSIWVKVDYSKNKTMKANYQIGKLEIDCKSIKYRTLQLRSYPVLGEPLYSQSWNDYESEWNDAIPGSISETMVKRVCGQ